MSDKPHVHLAMPGYGDLTSTAARGFYCANSNKLEVFRTCTEGSLLAQNFNALWCYALNRKLAGEQVDYFAMQHSDVEPDVGWLDKMVEEIEAKDLDLLGVVVPIKCLAGLTSIALGRDDHDTWRVKCRLTMKEVFDLPETFTSEDVGAPLLLNTGLWVCRFDWDWITQVHFTINDRIIKTEKGEFHAEVEPEDWYFSRLCHELGLKIGATRKVGLTHSGKQSFSNQFVWGDRDFDTEYVSESVLSHNQPAVDSPLAKNLLEV